MYFLALGVYNAPNIGRLLLAPTTKLVDNVGQNKSFHTEHNEDGEPPRVLITGKFLEIEHNEVWNAECSYDKQKML